MWHLLFGRGLVATTDDFGGLGSPPTHPALLDWAPQLAFKHKKRHGRSKGSCAQSFSVMPTADAHKARRTRPPRLIQTTIFLDSARLRRLRAEQLRDAMLAISGELDGTQGGPPVAIHLTEFMTGRGRPAASGPLNGNNRRSLYLGVHRNFAHPMLSAFDCPTPNAPMGRRNTSNVPAQALALMNDPFVLEAAAAWAKKILAMPELLTNEERVRLMSLEAFGRAPSNKEMAIMLLFLADGEPQEQFKALAHAHFLGKSFLFME